jgi:hypothetical protein
LWDEKSVSLYKLLSKWMDTETYGRVPSAVDLSNISFNLFILPTDSTPYTFEPENGDAKYRYLPTRLIYVTTLKIII